MDGASTGARGSAAASTQPRRVAVLAFSPLGRDSRVMRTVQSLAGWGHAVTALGFGTRPADLPPEVAFIALPEPERGLRSRLGLVLSSVPARLAPGLAAAAHGLRAHHRAARRALLSLRPEVVHANDWPTLPAALAARAACGARIVYDSHEFATEEHAGRPAWRLLLRPHVMAIEALGVKRASRVLTVSDGIAQAMARLHALPETPGVLRNLPPYESHAFHAPGATRRLLFHGLLLPGRGIETAIAAMALLPEHYVLTIRGDGPAPYLRALVEQAGGTGAGGRVRFEPAVPRAEVVARANRDADLGLLLLSDVSGQARFALPNKLFEYAMAGLAVLISPGEDRAAVIGAHGFGRVVPAADPAALAATLRAMTDEEIATMKRASLAAARSLNWEAEREVLRRAYAGL